jgi:hypothetical protein
MKPPSWLMIGAVGGPLIFYEQLAALPVGWQTSVDVDVSERPV